MDFFSETVRKLALVELAACDEETYRVLLAHMRWSIEDALNLLRFLRNERQIDDGVKIVMKSNLVDTSDGDDGYKTFYDLLELYDGNWLAALDFIKTIPTSSLGRARSLYDVKLKIHNESQYIGNRNRSPDLNSGSSNTLIDHEFETTLGPIQSLSYPTVDVAYEVLDKYSRSVGFTVSKVNTTFRQQTESQKLANEPKVIIRQYFNCTCHAVDPSDDPEDAVGSKRKNSQKKETTKKNDCKFKCCAALTSTGEYAFRELRNHHNHQRQDIQAIKTTKKLSIEQLNLIRDYHAQGLSVQEIFSKVVNQHQIQIGIRKIYRLIASMQKKVKVDHGIGIELGSIHDIAVDSAFPGHDHFDSSDCDA